MWLKTVENLRNGLSFINPTAGKGRFCQQTQSLKSKLPAPEDLDNVPQDHVEYQSTRVNTAIHTLTSDYLKQDYHPEVIANVLFSQWLRLSVLYGVSEQEWQKMNHYFIEILTAVRNYIPTIRI